MLNQLKVMFNLTLNLKDGGNEEDQRMNGFATRLLGIFSLTFILISCTEELPQEGPPVEPVPSLPTKELNEDGASEEISQKIVNEIAEILNPGEQEADTATNPQDQVEGDESELITGSDSVEENIASTDEESTSEDDLIASETAPEVEVQEGLAVSEEEISEQETAVEQSDEASTGTVEVVLTPKPREFDEYGRVVSDEQDFAAVVQRESIESDIQRIKENEEKLVIYDPIDHPDKEGLSDVVSFALSTKHTPGTVLFRRNTLFFNRESYLERCDSFADSEAAQQAFLDAGGPDDDDLNLDPDGDGFACSWNPEKYRLILQ